MDHVVGPLHILLAEKKGGYDLILYVSNFINLRELFGGVCQSWNLFWNLPWDLSWNLSCWKKYWKIHGLPEFLLDAPLGGGSNANSGRPCTLVYIPPFRTPCRLFIHKLFFGPVGLHLLVWSELGLSPPFRPMRALTLPWSRAFSLVCEVALTFPSIVTMRLMLLCLEAGHPGRGGKFHVLPANAHHLPQCGFSWVYTAGLGCQRIPPFQFEQANVFGQQLCSNTTFNHQTEGRKLK
jgi:hypothetical protein